MPILNPRRGLPAILAALLVFLLAPPAHAGVELEVTSILGESGPSQGEILVQIRNPDRRERRGTVVIEEQTGRVHARTSFVVGPNATSIVKLVALPSYDDITVARDEAGEEIGRASRSSRGAAGFVLFEIPPRDATLLPLHVDAGTSFALRRSGGGAIVTAALTDPSTGVSILPDRPSSYARAALVLVPAGQLDTLDATARDVLFDWVKGGGSLAIGVRDAFDLGRPVLVSLVGAGVKTTPYVPRVPEVSHEEEEHVGPTLSAAVADKLTDFTGGRLRPSRFGAVAEVGLGNVYLLPIDPWSKEANGDRWVQAQLVELAGAEEPRAMIASTSRDDGFYAAPILRVLDTNESFRPALAIATLLLALYAIGVGPIVFRRLAKRGPALAPYRWTLVASAGTFTVLIVLGVFAKGGFGSRSRQLAFVEVASGETVAIERSFRSFYTSREQVLDIAASVPRSTFGDPSDRGAIFATTATGESALEHVTVRPWETVVVREDATIALGQGITLGTDGDELVVTNRSGAGLRDALVSSPALGCLGFGAIADGAVARSSAAKRLEPMLCEDGPNRSPAWAAIRSAFSGRPVQGHRSILVGELDRPAAPSTAGFRVDRRNVLVRVVGGAS